MTNTTAPSRVLVIISTVVVALVLLFASSVEAGSELDPTRTVAVTVRGGDTLWEIAADHKSPGQDTREVIDAIRRLNHLDSSLIAPGQVLQVPGS